MTGTSLDSWKLDPCLGGKTTPICSGMFLKNLREKNEKERGEERRNGERGGGREGKKEGEKGGGREGGQRKRRRNAHAREVAENYLT